MQVQQHKNNEYDDTSVSFKEYGRVQLEKEFVGGAREDWLGNGEVKALKLGSEKIFSEINIGLIVQVNSGRADSAEKDFMICLQLLIWFWMTALWRGLTFPEDTAVPHGSRIPMKVRLMVSITRISSELFRLTERLQRMEL